MTGMEYEVLDSLWTNDGGIHYYLVAERLRISSAYAYLICKGLERGGHIQFDTLRGICQLKEQGKEAIERNWIFKLKRRKERDQRKIFENKKRISKNIETIKY